MKNLILRKLFVILNAALISIFIAVVPATMQDNCPHQGDYAHWQCGVTVYYTFDSSIPNSTDSSSEMQQVISAFNAWNIENLSNNSKVHFEYSPSGFGVLLITVNNDTSIGQYQAARAKINLASNSTGYAIDYTISFNPNSKYGDANALAINPNADGYDTAFYKLALHEIGHTMGLGDYHPENDLVAYDACASETPGLSVMNNFCGVNDKTPGRADNIPLAPTTCDRTSLNGLIYTTPCPTPTPTPTPTPGYVAGQPGVACALPEYNYTGQPCGYGYTADSTGYYCCQTGCTIRDDDPSCVEQRDECENNGGNWKGCCRGCFSPIVIDVAGNGFNLTDGNHGVMLDLTGEGTKDKIAWTAADSDDA